MSVVEKRLVRAPCQDHLLTLRLSQMSLSGRQRTLVEADLMLSHHQTPRRACNQIREDVAHSRSKTGSTSVFRPSVVEPEEGRGLRTSA